MKTIAELMFAGRWAEGWELHERRPELQRILARLMPFPEWRGEDLAGKRLLICAEQGLGDQIWMARLFGRTRAARVTFAGHPLLQRLFAQLPVDFQPMLDGLGVDRHDFWVSSMSLPHRLGITPDTVPAEPYLAAAARVGPARVGVMHRGEPKNRRDQFRSLASSEAERLLAIPGAMSLHPSDTGAADFLDTAEIIAGLDLIVSVDTSVAHLAGAMGKPVWILLAIQGQDWRWGAGATTPWYPTARLIRQQQPGDWQEVVGRVVAELAP